MSMRRFWYIILLLAAIIGCSRPEILPQADREQGSGTGEPGSGGTGDGTGQGGSTPGAAPERLIPVLPSNGTVPEIHIRTTEANWQALLDAYNKDNKTQEYIPADVYYSDGTNKESVLGAGLRLKGNTSRRYPGEAGNLHHVHFGLHFSEFTKGPKMLGVSRLDLKWFKDDPAYCREVYCYDLFNRYGIWTAISAGYTRLWIQIGNNPETYMGVYELMEHVRGDYVKRRSELFGGSDGHLWKARWGADMKKADAWMGADDNKNDYTYELKSDATDFTNAKTQLQNFLRNLNNLSGEQFYAWAQDAMDVEFLLKSYAVNVAVGMWDDYWNNSNNYYFYFNPDGKFFFIPYDYDNTLGTSKDCGVIQDSGTKDPLKWGHQSYPLLMKLLGKPEWKAYYIACLKELCAGDFGAEASATRIKAWQNQIAPYVSNDTGEDMVIQDLPASWSNRPNYRILEQGSNNFFTVKARVINSL